MGVVALADAAAVVGVAVEAAAAAATRVAVPPDTRRRLHPRVLEKAP